MRHTCTICLHPSGNVIVSINLPKINTLLRPIKYSSVRNSPAAFSQNRISEYIAFSFHEIMSLTNSVWEVSVSSGPSGIISSPPGVGELECRLITTGSWWRDHCDSDHYRRLARLRLDTVAVLRDKQTVLLDYRGARGKRLGSSTELSVICRCQHWYFFFSPVVSFL